MGLEDSERSWEAGGQRDRMALTRCPEWSAGTFEALVVNMANWKMSRVHPRHKYSRSTSVRPTRVRPVRTSTPRNIRK
ncbi:unnamed protein product [Nesidiocoris tenuis]|uniref:Uncharacterized protein n=1 Tax=Nesidiocoris tenuis TaxID=355587 RepID=A0A6H5HDG0_9HEMI|nr:unnamed protein product [Nesidiocoris tenuis]